MATVGPPDKTRTLPALVGLKVKCMDEVGLGKIERKTQAPTFQTFPDSPPNFSRQLETSATLTFSGYSQCKQSTCEGFS